MSDHQRREEKKKRKKEKQTDITSNEQK